MVFASRAAKAAGGHPDAANHLYRWCGENPLLEDVVCTDYWVPVCPHPSLSDFQQRIGAQMREDVLVRGFQLPIRDTRTKTLSAVLLEVRTTIAACHRCA